MKALDLFIRGKWLDMVFDDRTPQIEDIAHMILNSIKYETSLEVLNFLFQWIMDNCGRLDDSLLTNLIDCLAQSICNLDDTEKMLDEYWNGILKNKTVKNIMNPAGTIGVKHGNLSFDMRQAILQFALKLFDFLVENQNPLHAIKMFAWFARISGWNLVIDPNLQIAILDFMITISCDENHRIVYANHKIAYSIFTHDPRLLTGKQTTHTLPLDQLLFSTISILKHSSRTLVFIKTLDVLKRLLQQKSIWIHQIVELQILADTVVNIILKETACENLHDLPANFKKHDVFSSLYQVLLYLLCYKTCFTKTQQDSFISTFLFGLGRWPPIAKNCIQGLSLALFELPNSIIKYLPAVLMKISQVTSSHLALANLEFLTALASLPHLHVNLTVDDYKRIFGIVLTYLRQRSNQSIEISTQAFYSTQLWFLSLRLTERKKYVPMLIATLLANVGQTSEKVLDESVELVLFAK